MSMDSSSAAHVNELLETIRNEGATFEKNCNDLQTASTDCVRRMRDWARSVASVDREHNSLILNAVSELEEKRVAEQEMERLAKQACASKETEMVRLEQQCDQALKEVENLRRKRDCMPEEESRLKDMLASREERLNKHTNHVRQKISKSSDAMQSELNTIAALQTVLGLKVEAVEDRRLKFSFSQIDANDPEATFGVSVLTKDKRFEAFDCTPLIAQFADLSERLYNGDLSIIAFVKAIRRGFMEYSKSVVG